MTDWHLINDKIEEAVSLVQKNNLVMVEGEFGTDDEINHWQYKIWLPKKHQKKLNSKKQKRLGVSS